MACCRLCLEQLRAFRRQGGGAGHSAASCASILQGPVQRCFPRKHTSSRSLPYKLLRREHLWPKTLSKSHRRPLLAPRVTSNAPQSVSSLYTPLRVVACFVLTNEGLGVGVVRVGLEHRAFPSRQVADAWHVAVGKRPGPSH